MTTAAEQVLPAGDERLVDIKARHAAQAADRRSALMLVLGDHNHRPVKPLRQPTGDDPHHPGMPAPAMQNQRRISHRIVFVLGLLCGCQHDAPLNGVALFVVAVDDLGQLHCPGGIGRGEQFDAQRRLPQSPRCVEPRGQPKGHILALKMRFFMELRQLHEVLYARPPTLPQALQPMLDEDSVFVDQRHDIGHCTQRRIADAPQQHFAQPGSHLLGAAGTRGNRPRELESDSRPAQLSKRIACAGQPRMHEHIGLGK